MNDLDVLVSSDQALSAIKLLRGLGWAPIDFTPTEEYISVSYSHGFKDGSGQECDLHWHILSQCREPDSDKDFWDAAVETTFFDVPTYVLNPTDQLLHVCIHGARWNYTPPFRWVADATIILNTAQSEIDWGRLISQAKRRRLILPLREALRYVRTQVAAPVPAEIMRNLQDISIPRIEQIEYAVAITPPTRWTAILDLWCQHSRLTRDVTLPRRLARFPGFLRGIWGKSLWRIPLEGISRVANWRKNPLARKY
jgi:hypothetical protein